MVNPYEAFPHLLEPLKIGNTLFRNRMFCAPTGHADIIPDGQPSMDVVMTFERIAIGGAATVAEGEVCVDPTEFGEGRWPREITRNTNYNYSRIGSVVTRHGAVASMELSFSGSGPHPISRGKFRAAGIPLEGPVDMTLDDGMPVVEMKEERILQIIKGYGQAALAAKNAGFGMVALHAAHARALQHWFNPYVNTRKDKWGGPSIENRCRFAVEAIDEIHRVCGRDFPVEIRISGTEIVEDGYDLEEGCRIAEQLDGHADIINVSLGSLNSYTARSFSRTHLTMFYPGGYNVYLAAEIKKHVKKSYVGTVGGLCDPYLMEEIIASGKADIVYMARELVCDPDFPNKVRTGKPETIRKCMRCNQCFSELVGHGEFVCAINPESNRDRENYYALPAPVKQRVLVIGGGIAGMQAALTAAQNGHDVTLCERGSELGGRILCEKDVPFKANLHSYIEQQKAAIGKEKINVLLNTEMTPELAKLYKPDVVIAAVGSDPVLPPIPGIDGKNVVMAADVFANPELAKGKVVVLGAGLVGTELSIYLKQTFGKEPEIIEMTGFINVGSNSTGRYAVQDMIDQLHIPLHFRTKAKEITAEGIRCEGPEGKVFYPADTVIVAAGMKPCEKEALSFRTVAPLFYMIGECRQTANILYATSGAYTVAKYIGRYAAYN